MGNRFYVSTFDTKTYVGGAEILGEQFAGAMKLRYMSARSLGIDVRAEEYGHPFLGIDRYRIAQEMDDTLKDYHSDITLFNSLNCWSRKPNADLSVAVCAENIEKERDCMKDNEGWLYLKNHELGFQKKALANADKTITITKGEQKSLKEMGRNSMVIEPYIDTDVFKPLDRKIERTTALFVGRVSDRKGWDLVLRAAEEFPDIKFNCVVHKEPCVCENIEMIEHVSPDRLCEMYNESSFLFMPSRYESFGYVYAEALACNTPIVTTNVGLFEEMDDELRAANVVVATEKTEDAVNEAIREFLSKKNYKEIRDLMTNRKIAERRFSEQRFRKECDVFLGNS